MFFAILFLIFPSCVLSVLYGRTHLPPKHVVVSFDDGPNNITTPKLLDTLLEHNIKATFFMVGVNIDNSKLMHRMISEGHIAGSHTFGHAHMTRLSFEEMKDQIVQTEERFQKHIGDRPWFFRAPYGELNSKVTSFLESRGYQIIGWDDDTFDWQKSSPQQVVSAAEKLLNKHETGAIMLMHEYVWTTEAQKTLLPKIKSLGWQFSNPIDILTPEQLTSLKEKSCVANVCQTHALTRPWCCSDVRVRERLTQNINMQKQQTLLRTQRPVAQQIQRAWKEQKREIYSTVSSMEQRLQNQIDNTLANHSENWKVELVFATGVWSATLCCVILFLCLKLYKLKHKKKR